MFCPRCAAPIEGGKFCRSCGANVSLVPQALTGDLAVGVRPGSGGRGQMPGIEKATASLFSGIGLIFAALAALKYAPAGRIWWFWILIPAFASIGRAVGQYLKYRAQQHQHFLLAPVVEPSLDPARVGEPLFEASTPVPPASITEGTTRHLVPIERSERDERGER